MRFEGLSLIDGTASMTGKLLLPDSRRRLGKGLSLRWHGRLRPIARVGGGCISSLGSGSGRIPEDTT